ncbi:MAG: NAD(P)-binding protein [Candidatus Lokiarchaeota archaeon]|nr:NAD(P)-binding protein [Candidatus Lokiarchaeota archaeon]
MSIESVKGIIENIQEDKEYFDVSIIGGGASGTACAALLSSWGLKVILIEKRGHLGGRASTLGSNFGYMIDTGVHGIPYYDLGSLKGIEKELDLEFELIDYNPLLVFYDAAEELCVEVSNFSNEGLKEVNRIWSPNGEFMRLINYLRNVNNKKASELDRISVKNFIQRYSPTHQFYQLIRAINGMITIEPHLGSAGEFIRSFSKLFSSKRPITYPKHGGIQYLSEELGDICVKNDGKILLYTEAKQILLEKGRVIGINCEYNYKKETKIEFKIESKSIINTIPLQFLFEIIDRKNFSDRFSKKINSLKDKQSCAQGIAFSFKEELLKDFPWDPKCWGAIVFQPGKKPRYLSVPSALVPDLSPEGKHFMFYGIVVTPEEIKDRKLSRKRIKELKSEIFQLLPNLKDLKEWQFDGSSEMVLGTSKRVGMTGDYKPKNKSEDIEGLFFAGDTASGNGPGLECTFDSAYKCSKIVFNWIKKEYDKKQIN